LIGELAERGVETVFFFGSGRFASAFFAAAGALGWTPDVYAPGPLLGREAFTAPPVFDGKIFLSFPTLPTDTTPRGLEAYRRLASRHPLPDGNQASQISALAAAEVLVEGLQRAGRDLSREQLITALEGLYEHETGLTPPLSFGPNRRIGAQGAYVMAVDLAAGSFRPVGDWVEVR
jgi:ABC-type branched-subunit amino acid transport system substrate-binding protein